MTNCDLCEFKDNPDIVCHALATGHKRYCELIAEGREDYRQLVRDRSTGVVISKPDRSLLLRASLTSWTGYGQHAAAIGHGLTDLGVKVTFEPLGVDERYLPIASFVKERIGHDDSGRCLQLSPPNVPMADKRCIFFSMWESSHLSPEAVANLNRAEAVLVPCQFNVNGFGESGVNRPIHIVPMGIDPKVYYPRQNRRQPVTFGMAARLAHGGIRKGLAEGMAAFVAAFDKGEDVRLKIKIWEDCRPMLDVPDDSRITVTTTPMTPLMMAKWYEGIDVLFVPSKGEGWGCHSHQAMACKRPIISTDASGSAEFFDERSGWVLPYTWEDSGEFYSGQGQWAVPSHDGMVAAMRHAFTHQDEVRVKGAFAAQRAREFTWDYANQRLHRVLVGLGFLAPPEPTAVTAMAQEGSQEVPKRCCGGGGKSPEQIKRALNK